ncbi:MAG: hypothetical protein ACYDHW_06795 [Syntrophorhabdaceae bacterium]
MKIDFTNEQYQTLLKMAYLGHWIANVWGEDHESNEYSEMQSYLFGFAKDFGLEEFADYDEQAKTYYPAADFEENEELNEIIDWYDDNAFLDKLIHNLAGRDMLEKHGEKELREMSDDKFFKEEGFFVQKYQSEIAKNGIKNLMMKIETKKPRKKL